MTAQVHLDLIKESAYELWMETQKPFCAVDVYDKMSKSIDYKTLPSFREIGKVLKNASWAEPRRSAGLNISYVTYMWIGD